MTHSVFAISIISHSHFHIYGWNNIMFLGGKLALFVSLQDDAALMNHVVEFTIKIQGVILVGRWEEGIWKAWRTPALACPQAVSETWLPVTAKPLKVMKDSSHSTLHLTLVPTINFPKGMSKVISIFLCLHLMASKFYTTNQQLWDFFANMSQSLSFPFRPFHKEQVLLITCLQQRSRGEKKKDNVELLFFSCL